MMIDRTSIPADTKFLSPASLAAITLVVLSLVLLPFVWDNRFYISLINEMLIFGLLAMSLDVLLGYTGLLSFMHNAYLGIGAYVVGLFLIHISPSSIWIAALVGIAVTSLIALPVGWVQVRTGGLAFALLTLAFGMMFYTVVWKWYSLTGGDDGLMGVPTPDIRRHLPADPFIKSGLLDWRHVTRPRGVAIARATRQCGRCFEPHEFVSTTHARNDVELLTLVCIAVTANANSQTNLVRGPDRSVLHDFVV